MSWLVPLSISTSTFVRFDIKFSDRIIPLFGSDFNAFNTILRYIDFDTMKMTACRVWGRHRTILALLNLTGKQIIESPLTVWRQSRGAFAHNPNKSECVPVRIKYRSVVV